MDWLLILSIMGAIGTIFTVVQVTKGLWPTTNSGRTDKAKALLYPGTIIALTAVTVYLATLNQELTEIKSQAKSLRQQWPTSISGYYFNGENLGIVNGGLSFVEQYKDHIPVTVEQARELAIEARRLCVAPDRYDACNATAGGMIGLIEAIANDSNDIDF